MRSPLYLAMWSGPRNISTAMMRSWGSRDDTIVVDEPFYAFFLDRTGRDDPGREEVLRSQPLDWREVAANLTAPLPPGKQISYQKQMSHHLLPEVGYDWMAPLTHVFLIREPARMLSSLDGVLETPELRDTGMPQQGELFERLCQERGEAPPVIDARDVLQDPRGMLTVLCHAVGVEFQPAMLRWEAGPRPTDGVWGEHWYRTVVRSTGFMPYRERAVTLSPALEAINEACQPIYERLYAHRLTVETEESPHAAEL